MEKPTRRLLCLGVLVIVIAAVSAVVAGLRWLNYNRLSYVERVTDVEFPSSVSQIDLFDNLEYFMVAHARLRDTDVKAFVNRYGFDTSPVEVTLWIELLTPENRTIPADADLLYLEDWNNSNRWLFVLDQKSGRLWMVVFYPDPGGETY